MDMLFPQLTPPPTDGGPGTAEGPFAVVAIEQGIDRVLDYSVPGRLRAILKVGQRVKVPLGRNNKPTTGYVVDIHPTSNHPKTKPVGGLIDERVLVRPPMLKLARWISRYYVAPLGIVLESIIPSAVKKQIGIGYTVVVRAAVSAEELQKALETTKTPKRRSLIARLLQLRADEPIDLDRLANEAGVAPATVRKLAKTGLIVITREADWTEPDVPAKQPTETGRTLNATQQVALDKVAPLVDAGGFSVSLLHGVTGSGKTEVYMQAIARAVAKGKQAIVTVPEIALTPQTVRRFVARFGRVAVLHSGLSQTDRHRFWQQVASGKADVVVGARSAVFAPVPNLGMIVVDEEHEPSYKQDTAPRYHGRDVAIKRAQLEDVPVLLGSATPSLESFYRVTHPPVDGPVYQLLRMPDRVHGGALPHVEVIDMKQENRFRKGVHLLSQRLEYLLRTAVESRQQAILLLNRRGYSNFVYCPSCGEAIQCKYCDATMTYHRSVESDVLSAKSSAGVHSGQLHCHYCMAVNPLPEKCETCGKKLSLFGLGTQRVEEEIKRKFPELIFNRVDSDSMRGSRDYEKILGQFGRNEIQVLLGTQMISKGLDYPNVTLVGVVSGDTALALPDFRSAERTFQMITQVAGRAGRGALVGRVVLQTFMPDDPTIRFAIKQDYEGFAAHEMKTRKEVGLPPFTRMARIVMRDQDADKLHKASEDLAAAVHNAIGEMSSTGSPPRIQVKGPMPCPISRIAGFFRDQVVLVSDQPSVLQKVLAELRKGKALATHEKTAVDVDPVSLL